MSSKIEIIVPRVTNLYPEPSEIKQFASLFTFSEWNKVCLDRQFNIFILEDLTKAKTRAESILCKVIGEIKKETHYANPS
jgi:hypothetical protein